MFVARRIKCAVLCCVRMIVEGGLRGPKVPLMLWMRCHDTGPRITHASCVQNTQQFRTETAKRIDQPVEDDGSFSVHNLLFLIKFMDPYSLMAPILAPSWVPFPFFHTPMFLVPPRDMDLMDPYPPDEPGVYSVQPWRFLLYSAVDFHSLSRPLCPRPN